MTRFSSPTTRAGSGVAKIFMWGWGIISTLFQTYFFGRTDLKLIKKQEKLVGGPGGMLPRKMFENLHAVMAILVHFKYFSSKLCFNFLTLIPSASPNRLHFVRTVLIMRA